MSSQQVGGGLAASAHAAVALHDYARSSPQPRQSPSKDDEIVICQGTASGAALGVQDADDERDEASPSPRKAKTVNKTVASNAGSLGTAISQKAMSKREPLPMKLRALPRSFWMPPNTNQNPSPGSLFTPLPPLTREDTIPVPQGGDLNSADGNGSSGGDVSSGGASSANRSLNSSSSSSNGWEILPSPNPSGNRGIVSPADTELLFSLFRAVEKFEPAKKPTTVRRGRPRRGGGGGGGGAGGSQFNQRQIRDDDPCLVTSVTEHLLPNLSGTGSRTTNPSFSVPRRVSLQAGTGPRSANENLGKGGGTVALPCLQANASYSQILSELVVKL